MIVLYALSWNESRMLDFFFRHYEPWVDRFVFFDDGSTDGTVEILREKPNVEVRRLEYSFPESLVLSGRYVYDNCWKESRGRADWVVVTDIDEHLHLTDIQRYLRVCKAKGVTSIPALGYEMVTDTFPSSDEWLAKTRTVGSPQASCSKLRIFDPSAVAETNFALGGHSARPAGRIVLPRRDELLLLHYKHLGVDYTHERNLASSRNLRAQDRQNGWGFHYLWTRADYEQVRANLYRTAVNISDPKYRPWRDHREPRWWRSALEEAAR